MKAPIIAQVVGSRARSRRDPESRTIAGPPEPFAVAIVD